MIRNVVFDIGWVFVHLDHQPFLDFLSAHGAHAPDLESVLAGPTCDSIDVIAENLMLPKLEAGDLIVGRAMGAYTWASASEFNFFPKATVVAVNGTPGDTGTVMPFPL